MLPTRKMAKMRKIKMNIKTKCSPAHNVVDARNAVPKNEETGRQPRTLTKINHSDGPNEVGEQFF